jgi:dTDP-4-amino-4,6-dideoxygalactose transaminase
MWSRKRFDIGWLDLWDGVLGCLTCRDRLGWQARVEELWLAQGDALACLSVRSGWDLLLTAADFPPGSEVLMSAVTIPDMARIVEHHGLVVVPLDLEPETMLPRPEQIAAAVTPRTKAVVIAHLFGASAPLDAHIAVAHQHGLLFVEDCAQAFRGLSYTGHPQADASLFSFGTIKTATALGGALLRVRDAAMRERMGQLQAEYPVQSRWAYLERIVKYMGLKGVSYRAAFQALIGLLRRLGKDFDRVLNNSIRGFPADRLIEQIRQQPCAPLLRLIERRLRTFDETRQIRRTQRGRQLADQLGGSAACPGLASSPHVFWVFPLLADSPDAVIALLRRHGFDATQGQSLVALEAPPGREEDCPHTTQHMTERLLFLPFYNAMPDCELHRMANVLVACRTVASRPSFAEGQEAPVLSVYASLDYDSTNSPKGLPGGGG